MQVPDLSYKISLWTLIHYFFKNNFIFWHVNNHSNWNTLPSVASGTWLAPGWAPGVLGDSHPPQLVSDQPRPHSHRRYSTPWPLDLQGGWKQDEKCSATKSRKLREPNYISVKTTYSFDLEACQAVLRPAPEVRGPGAKSEVPEPTPAPFKFGRPRLQAKKGVYGTCSIH